MGALKTGTLIIKHISLYIINLRVFALKCFFM